LAIHKIILKVNGENQHLEVESNRTLIQVIRDDLRLTGTKTACERGDCGLCTVLLDGSPVKSCLILAVEADRREITTIEGLAKSGKLTQLQKSFIDHGAFQCGFCTSAFLLSAEALLRENPSPTEKQVTNAIGGIICRCTGYRQIVDAILDASSKK
jgi:aerobic carbon-monoxide dehydrogenase small subunit